MDIDWDRLRAAAIEAMGRAYAPYSQFPVGAAALVDDGRIVIGCNVENASYGVTLCAECGLVSALHASGGGRLVALSCVDGTGAPLMPCGRCRQLLYEHGGPDCLIDARGAPRRMAELLPHAFGPADLDRIWGEREGGRSPSRGDDSDRVAVIDVPARLLSWRGRGTVFVHPDLHGGKQVWTAYWERASGAKSDESPGILEEGAHWPTAAEGVAWGLARTPRVVVVDADGAMRWAGEGDPPAEIPESWNEQ